MRVYSTAAEVDARRAKVAELWRSRRSGLEIAATLGVPLSTIWSDARVLQDQGVIARRHVRKASMNIVLKAHGRPNRGVTTEAEREKKREAYVLECAGHANAKRVVVVRGRTAETRVLGFFATPDEAKAETVSAMVGPPSGRVVSDTIYVIDKVGGYKHWVLSEVLEARAA